MPKRKSSSTKSPAQRRAMKLGQQIRTIRGCCTQLRNLCEELNLFGSFETINTIERRLETSAHNAYDQDINKL